VGHGRDVLGHELLYAIAWCVPLCFPHSAGAHLLVSPVACPPSAARGHWRLWAGGASASPARSPPVGPLRLPPAPLSFAVALAPCLRCRGTELCASPCPDSALLKHPCSLARGCESLAAPSGPFPMPGEVFPPNLSFLTWSLPPHTLTWSAVCPRRRCLCPAAAATALSFGAWPRKGHVVLLDWGWDARHHRASFTGDG